MKQLFFIAAIASVALVGCTKNEVAPADPQEITYMTSPVTKALDPLTQTSFHPGNEFLSWAYYTGGTSWAYPTNPTEWIDGAQIGYTGGVWKDDSKSYYWPKDNGKLTFFAFSDNTADPALVGATVSCTSETGITISSFDIRDNVNVDLLVADPAKDKQANTNTYEKNGVPTLFRHKLAYVEFKIKYQLPSDGVTTLTLNSITLNDLNTKGAFTQHGTAIDDQVGKWDLDSEVYDFIYTNTATVFTDAPTNLTPSQYLYLPQTFDGSQTVTVIYTATGTGGSSKPHTLTGDLMTIFSPDSGTTPGKWEIGKKYICTITITPDEILWDPAVQNWDEVTGFTATL